MKTPANVVPRSSTRTVWTFVRVRAQSANFERCCSVVALRLISNPCSIFEESGKVGKRTHSKFIGFFCAYWFRRGRRSRRATCCSAQKHFRNRLNIELDFLSNFSTYKIASRATIAILFLLLLERKQLPEHKNVPRRPKPFLFLHSDLPEFLLIFGTLSKHP